MKTPHYFSLRLLFVCTLIFSSFSMGFGQVSAETLKGIWMGRLAVGGSSLRIGFYLENDGGKVTGYMTSPDQGDTKFALGEVLIKGDSISIPVPTIRGEFAGKYNTGNDNFPGEWRQGANKIPTELNRVEEIKGLSRPQTPTGPFPYAVEEVTYANPAGGNQLAGTLTLPEGAGPFPVAILISGSGPQDRDETIAKHKPFWVIADHLTRQGIAVLRFDDRGIGGSTGDFSTATSADFATDVSAGMDYLLSRKEISKDQIGLIGHSEGGLVGPMVAKMRDDVAFLVMVAGPGTTGEQVLKDQAKLIAAAEGASEAQIALLGRYQEGIFPILQQDAPVAKIKKKAQKFHEKFLKSEPAELLQEAQMTEDVLNSNLRVMIAPWYRSFLQYDPAEYLPHVKCPVLAINGENDLQIEPKANLAGIKSLITSGGNTEILIHELPKLNHLFQTSETGAISEYMQLEETFAPVALRLIAGWITEQTTN